MNFKEELEQRTREAEEIIKSYLPKEEGFAKNMAEAMNYSMLSGGKRLRPVFMREVYSMFGGTGKVIEPFMARKKNHPCCLWRASGNSCRRCTFKLCL